MRTLLLICFVVLCLGAFLLYQVACYSFVDIKSARLHDIYSGKSTIGNNEKKEILDWLESHRTGWSPSIVTYAMKQRYSGEGFVVNVTSGTVVMNYSGILGAKRWVQIVRELSSDEIQFWNTIKEKSTQQGDAANGPRCSSQ